MNETDFGKKTDLFIGVKVGNKIIDSPVRRAKQIVN
jgi:hypothetical protein